MFPSYTDSFNSNNSDYDVALNRFFDCNSIGTNARDQYYDTCAPITFIANIGMFRKGTKDPAQGCDEFTPFQLIGIDNDRELPDEKLHYKVPSVGVDFAESVISRFDMSCCQFVIESPYKPGLVRTLKDDSLKLFCDLLFTYDMRKFTTNRVFKTRVSKYISKGYTLAGLTFGTHILNFENATFMDIRDYRANSATRYDTDNTSDSDSVSLILSVYSFIESKHINPNFIFDQPRKQKIIQRS